MEISSLNYGSLAYGSSFPTTLDGVGALDTFPVNSGVDYVTSQDMNLVQDAILNMQAKIGINNSAVVSSMDYRINSTTGGHHHNGVNSRKIGGLTSTYFASMDGSTITGLDPANFASGTCNEDITFTGTIDMSGATFIPPTIDSLDVTNDITVGGTVDGVDVAGLKSDHDTLASQVTAISVPVGSIIPLYDFNGAATFDTNYWAYCNGQSKTVLGQSRTLPDLSGRYLVGFGTDGGADIGGAAWADTVVGNASNQINIAHTHTGPSHTHAGPSHTHTLTSHYHTLSAHTHNTVAHSHTVSSHTHSITADAPGTSTNGSHFHNTNNVPNGNGSYGVSSCGDDIYSGSHSHTVNSHSHYGATGSSAPSTNTAAPSTGGPSNDTTSNSGTLTTAASGTANTGAGGTGVTSSTLSSTQSIQPISIRVRYIMRIL